MIESIKSQHNVRKEQEKTGSVLTLPLNHKQKRFLHQIHDGSSIAEACRTVGYSPAHGSKILKRADAKAYLEQLKEDEKKEIKEEIKDSPLLKAIMAVREINPLTKHLEKLDKDLSEIVEDYCIIGRQKERLSETQKERLNHLHKMIPVLQTYRRSLSEDPFKLFMEIKRMKKEEKLIAVARGREKGLIKQMQKKKDPRTLFGRGGMSH